MQFRNFASITMLSFASAAYASAVHAEGLTRDQVRQQLIEAQRNGLNFVTDASYPDVSPVYQHQVEQMRAHSSGVGAEPGASTQSGASKVAPAAPMQSPSPPHEDCVGPVSFCSVYFGS
jgi:hypothetical protein